VRTCRQRSSAAPSSMELRRVPEYRIAAQSESVGSDSHWSTHLYARRAGIGAARSTCGDRLHESGCGPRHVHQGTTVRRSAIAVACSFVCVALRWFCTDGQRYRHSHRSIARLPAQQRTGAVGYSRGYGSTHSHNSALVRSGTPSFLLEGSVGRRATLFGSACFRGVRAKVLRGDEAVCVERAAAGR
jgi:hypothetical protein